MAGVGVFMGWGGTDGGSLADGIRRHVFEGDRSAGISEKGASNESNPDLRK